MMVPAVKYLVRMFLGGEDDGAGVNFKLQNVQQGWGSDAAGRRLGAAKLRLGAAKLRPGAAIWGPGAARCGMQMLC